MPKKSVEIEFWDYVGYEIHVTCPYCGSEIEDNIWNDPADEVKEDIECWGCDKIFTAKSKTKL